MIPTLFQYACETRPCRKNSRRVLLCRRDECEFLAWYAAEKFEVFDNRVLELCCQDDVNVLREAFRVFRQEFIRIGNIDVFLESVTIASACNKLLRKRFLKPNTIGLILPGGYTGNVNYSNKAILWLLYRTDQRLHNIAWLEMDAGIVLNLPT